MPQIQDSIKKDRALDLIAYSNELEKEYALQFINKKMDIIVEQAINENEMIGHSSNFLQIVLPIDTNLIGKQVLVQIESIKENKLYAKLIKKM